MMRINFQIPSLSKIIEKLDSIDSNIIINSDTPGEIFKTIVTEFFQVMIENRQFIYVLGFKNDLKEISSIEPKYRKLLWQQ